MIGGLPSAARRRRGARRPQILVAVRLLKPLGSPSPYNVKFFAASELLEQVEDRVWLAKVTNALNQHWQRRNAAKKYRTTNDSPVPSRFV
jgi:hypothetical protein